MFIRKSGKREIKKGTDLPNQENIWTQREKVNYKCYGNIGNKPSGWNERQSNKRVS